MKRLIPKLTDQLEYLHDAASKIPVPKYNDVVIQGGSETITHDWLWPRVGQFFKSDDVILAETGILHTLLIIFQTHV
jgi:pyruvate decarboxylase